MLWVWLRPVSALPPSPANTGAIVGRSHWGCPWVPPVVSSVCRGCGSHSEAKVLQKVILRFKVVTSRDCPMLLMSRNFPMFLMSKDYMLLMSRDCPIVLISPVLLMSFPVLLLHSCLYYAGHMAASQPRPPPGRHHALRTSSSFVGPLSPVDLVSTQPRPLTQPTRCLHSPSQEDSAPGPAHQTSPTHF